MCCLAITVKQIKNVCGFETRHLSRRNTCIVAVWRQQVLHWLHVSDREECQCLMMGGVHYNSWQLFCTNNFCEIILFSAHFETNLSRRGLSLADHCKERAFHMTLYDNIKLLHAITVYLSIRFLCVSSKIQYTLLYIIVRQWFLSAYL